MSDQTPLPTRWVPNQIVGDLPDGEEDDEVGSIFTVEGSPIYVGATAKPFWLLGKKPKPTDPMFTWYGPNGSVVLQQNLDVVIDEGCEDLARTVLASFDICVCWSKGKGMKPECLSEVDIPSDGMSRPIRYNVDIAKWEYER